MTLPRYLTTVTSFSKIIAAVLFIIFPFAGFYIGLQYEHQFTQYLEDRTTVDQYMAKPNPVAVQNTSTANWKTYVNAQLGISFEYPNDWMVVSSKQSSSQPQ